MLERSRRLSADARAILAAAAVLADPADEPVLRAVAGLTAARLGPALAEVLRCGLLTEAGRGMVSFRHVLAARAVYEAITVPERRALHRRAGRALERRSPQPVAQLTRHFREAGQPAKWCRYAEQAADLALSAGDEATASALLLDLLTKADLPAHAVVRLVKKIPFGSFTGQSRFDDLVAHAPVRGGRPGAGPAGAGRGPDAARPGAAGDGGTRGGPDRGGARDSAPGPRPGGGRPGDDPARLASGDRVAGRPGTASGCSARPS